jgi:hypothetical protein
MYRSKFLVIILLFITSVICSAQPYDIQNKLELFVDDHLVALMRGTEWRLHHPVNRGTVLKTGNVPWEGPYTGYATVIKDGDKYKLYYRGHHSYTDGTYCYAESKDGKSWHKPVLGIHEYNGSKKNNIIIYGKKGSHSFSPFLDKNPAATSSQRYKALGLIRTKDDKRWELLAFVSPDGIHWQLLQDEPVMTEGAFDSQNVAFWSEEEKKYVSYYRTKSQGHTGLRQISRSVSEDFINWSEGEVMEYRHFGKPTVMEQMYINQTHPYFRAPHIYIATAARFMQGRRAVSEEKAEEFGKGNFKDCSDAVLMCTRGESFYERTFLEGWIRPGIGIENWLSRCNYPAMGIVPTGPSEMSVYVVEAYGQPNVRFVRYSMRTDGLISIHGPYEGGEMITKPILCPGGKLVLNYATSAAGYIKIEIMDARGQKITGYNEQDCSEILGDEIEGIVKWNDNNNLDKLKGKAVRLKFKLKDADIFSMKFGK